MENDLFAFICKLHLIYHFTDINKNEINPDQFFLKPKSTGTPPLTKNRELENLIRNLSNISFYNVHMQDFIINLHKDLSDLISLTTSMKINIKKAEKESWTVDELIQKSKGVLADKEYEYVKSYKIANYFMLP